MPAVDLNPVLEFLHCRSPQAWVAQACGDLDALLLDHALLELKAAQQAQKLIWKYGAAATNSAKRLPAKFRRRLVFKMSRLAREELRHFELVVAKIERRGGHFTASSPSRYAAGLHERVRGEEPGALIDALIVGAIIEARSCERFSSLSEPLKSLDADLADFYGSLLRSEARHFQEYLDLAAMLAPDDLQDRIQLLLQRDAELIQSPDSQLKFHSGPVASECVPPANRPVRRSRAVDRGAIRRSPAGTRR